MCDESNNGRTGAVEHQQIISSLQQILKALDSVKESVRNIKPLEQSIAALSQRFNTMAAEQARTSIEIRSLKGEISTLAEGQQRLLKLQEQQLLESTLTRLAAEITAIEMQKTREILIFNEQSKLQQQKYAAYWSSLDDAFERLSKLHDQLTKQVWLIAIKSRLDEPEAAIDNLQSLVDKRFALTAIRRCEELQALLLPDNDATTRELRDFLDLRDKWRRAKSVVDNLRTEAQGTSARLDDLCYSVQSRTDSLGKMRGPITGFFFNMFARTRYERKLEDAKTQLAQIKTLHTSYQNKLHTMSNELDRLTDQLIEVKSALRQLSHFFRGILH